MEIGGGNIEERPRQYLQGTPSQSVGGSAATPTTANTCNNLPLDNARPVAMETTSNPLSYWPPPSSDSPLTNNSKDVRDDGPRKQALLPDHSCQADSIRDDNNWAADKARANMEESPAPSEPLPKYPSTHNLPPIAAITSTHNYRGVREAAQKQAADAKPAEVVNAPSQQQTDGKMEGPEKSRSAPESEDPKPEERTQERPKTANSDYVFPVPNVVHSDSNGKTLPIPRAPTPFATVTSANNVNNHQYHSQPEALTLNISTSSGVSSGSPSPSSRIGPSPHFGGPPPTPNRLPTPNAPSPSESPRVLPSPHSNVPSPSSTSSRLHSSPHLNLSSPTADNNNPTARIPSSPQPPPIPHSNSVPSASNRYGSALQYPSYPYLNTPRSTAKSIPVQSFPVEPRKVLPSQTVSLPVRSNQNDTHSCRNPFELPVSKPYPQQQSFQHYPQVKPTNYYPYGKPGEKDYEAYKRTPQSQLPVPPNGLYSMDGPHYGPSAPHHQPQQHPPSQSQRPPTHQLQRDFVTSPRQGEVRTWAKSDVNIINQKGSYLNTQNKNSFSKVSYAGSEYPRITGEGYSDMQKIVTRQPNGGSFSGVGLCNPEKTPKSSSQTNSQSQRFPPVPQSNYDLNRQIYDRMTGNNHHQPPPPPPPPPSHIQQHQQQRTEKQFPQLTKPQMVKPHPYYRDYPSAPDKDKSKTYQDCPPNTSRSYGQYNFQVDDHKPMESYTKRVSNATYPFNSGDAGLSHQISDHHRQMSQSYGPCTNPQAVQEVAPADYDKTRFVNPQMVQTGKSRSLISAQVRPKRESPLDLSVKTVRQSADSTAKDDGDSYGQNFRGFIGPESRYHMSNGPTSAPKIDFTPNFSGFHAESQPKAEAASSVLPPVDSFKKLNPKPNHVDIKPQAFPVGKPVMEHSKYSMMEHHKAEAQKRLSNDALKSHLQPKMPKIDAWRLAMDQQIEQRLNSVRQSHHQAPSNGVDSSKTTTATSAQGSAYSRQVGQMYPRPPVQTSAAPYNPSSYLHQPQCQPATPQTPQDNIPPRDGVGHSPDPEQIIKQISKGVMPDHKLLQDKNVVSILRSSLEEKEAKLIQLREAARKKERLKEQEAMKKIYPNYEQIPRTFPQGKQSLPPFGAITLERICAPPSFPGHKLNVPRPMDTVKLDIEPTQNYLSPAVKHEAEKSGIPSIDLSPQDDAQGPPTDLDGLAAFLAARIRTKAELKQVGPSLDNLRALSSHQSPKASGLVTSLTEAPDRLQTPSQGTAPSGCSTTGSPPKLTRESRLLPPFRRRLFSHTEEDGSVATVSSLHGDEHHQSQPVRAQMPPRDPSGIRSSSETSVFDFRESDSEGEMPVLERQTLEGMRRDRKTFGSKQNVSTTTPDEPFDGPKPAEPEKIAELETSEPDPFWNTAFDMFVEQLEKRPPKRSVRKKRPHGRPSFSSDGKGDESKIPVPGTSISTGVEAVKTEPKEESNDVSVEVKVEPESENFEKHEKLSASRLRVYRNELMSIENKEKEMEAKAEEEKDIKMVTEEEIKIERSDGESDKVKTDIIKEGEKSKKGDGKPKDRKLDLRNIRITRATSYPKEDSSLQYDSDIDLRDLKSDSSSMGDDDDSISISGMESESTDSESHDESSNANFSSDGEDDDDSDSEGSRRRMRMQTRMQTRMSRQLRGTGMRLRSKAMPLPKATLRKCAKKKKKRKKRNDDDEYFSSVKKKKPSFGDGSHFRPGWEEECYKFKQQLRMPEKLISISRPPKRSSASLPDLDPYRNSPSMSLDSSDVSLPRKSEKLESENDTDEIESKRQKRKSNDASSQDSDTALTSLFTLRNGKKSQTNSILNMLVNKYGRLASKKQKEARSITERKSPRILPKGSDKPELLPTPSLGIGKENVLKDKKKGKDASKKKLEESDSVYLGYFRRKTVNNFKEAFKEKGGLLLDEFSPEILKSRTRMQTKVLKKRATLVEVFGEERPASAPPLSRVEDGASDAEKAVEKERVKPMPKKIPSGVVTRGKGMLTRGGRPGLRSAAVLRSNKAVQISKRHLNSGRQQRSIDLLRLRAMKKFRETNRSCDSTQPLANQKRLKLRSVRRKFRSGFDYIRKKKKMKKDGDSIDGSVKEKKVTAPRPNSESIADIQSEIKNWVINKGLGETILHRAARLGYTDIAAYCLEKMDCSPSPRDNAGYTPLHEACSRGHLDIAKLLLMYGASVSESAKGGIRPLHEAAENGYTELIRLLLSYGADPLLETYTGHTALSLVSDEDARRLIQHHLADVQGNVAPPWSFQGPASLFDPTETGCDPLMDPPSTETNHSEFELEVSDVTLPPLYRLADDYPEREPWILLRDLVACTKSKSREALLKQLNVNGSSREMKQSEFMEQAKCLNFLGWSERTNSKAAAKVVLIPYDEKVRQLLMVERVVV